MLSKVFQNKLFLKGALYSIFSFFNQGVSFILLIILANYIQPEEYGNLSLFNTLVMFISYFIAFSTHGYISVSFFKQKKDEFKKDLSTIIYIGMFMLILLSLISFVFGDQISSWLFLSTKMLYIAVIISFFQLIININLDVFRIKEQICNYGVISCSLALFNFIITLLLIINYKMGWEGRIWAQFISSICIGMVAVYYFLNKKMLTFNISRQRVKAILLWGIPLIPHLATIWIKQGCDRYIINYYYSIEDVGLFSFALNLVNIITMIGFAYNQINSVEIYKILGNKEITSCIKTHKLELLARNTFLIYLVSTAFIIAICSLLIPLFLPHYIASIKYFIQLSIYGLGVCVYLLYCNYLFFYNKNKNIMYITFLSSIFHLIISLLLTRYSLSFTSIAYVISQTTIVVSTILYSKKVLRENLL